MLRVVGDVEEVIDKLDERRDESQRDQTEIDSSHISSRASNTNEGFMP